MAESDIGVKTSARALTDWVLLFQYF